MEAKSFDPVQDARQIVETYAARELARRARACARPAWTPRELALLALALVAFGFAIVWFLATEFTR